MANDIKKLEAVLQNIAKKENYALGHVNIKPINSGGANYTTSLFLATISQPPKPDLELFAKVSNIDENARAKNDFMSRVYLTEGLFYSELTDKFENIYNKNNVSAEDRLVVPKHYGQVLIPYEETMILENLEAKGFKNFDRMKTFNWEYASTAVTQLARFHALGLAFRNENPTEFERLVSNFKFEVVNDQEMMEGMMQQTMKNVFEALSNEHGLRLQKFMSSMENPLDLMTNMAKDTTLLIHGDYRPSNIMHKRQNGKLVLIPLDFQMLRMGNPVVDLMFFIFSGSDEEFRRFHYQRLMDHYFTQLTVALRKLNVDVESLYPRKKFDSDLIENRPLGLLMSISIVGMVTVAPEDAPQFDGDVASIHIKLNALAQERVSGIIRDFIRWGVL